MGDRLGSPPLSRAPRLPALVAGLVDLVLPGGCAGCGRAAGARLRSGVCDACIRIIADLRPAPTRPDPAPVGLPPCVALGDYHGVLRELVLAYKDRGRHRLGRPLGRLLAYTAATMVSDRVALVPVPDTPAAARERHGDHLWRLARTAAAALRAAGMDVVVARPLRARARPDSVGLSAAGRVAHAATALRVRPARAAGLRRWVERTRGPVIVLDDVVTTGATIAAATRRLVEAGVPVAGAAVLAATARLQPPGR